MSEFIKLEELTDNVKEYLILNIEIIKLEVTNQISSLGASMVSSVIVGIASLLFLFSLSIGLGFYLSALFDDLYSGFAIVAAFYFLVVIILYAMRKKLIERPMRDKIVEKILENKES
jgi:hypothetical protein